MTTNKLTVSHAPFWHDGDSLFQMNLNIILALLPAALFGIIQFGAPALGTCPVIVCVDGICISSGQT